MLLPRTLKNVVVCVALHCVMAVSETVTVNEGISLELTTNQPAVKYAPIGFFSHLLGTNDSSAIYVYSWKSKGAGIKITMENQTTECNITATVAKPGTYDMKVFVDSGQGVIAKASIQFTVTETINGNVEIIQPGAYPRKPGMIATKTNTVINFAIHDPYNFFNESIFYGWFINAEKMASSKQSFNYSFTEAKNYDVMLLASAIKNSVVYYKSSVTNLKAKDPIQMLNISGQTTINHGDLLDVEIACTGSSPYSYCWHFAQGEVNTSAEKCSDPTMTTSCDILIVRYLKKTGNYKLVVVIDNDIDHEVTVYNINVFESAPEPQLSPIIVPLVCICLALLIVVVGITYYIQTRRNCSIEVADFDFQQSDVLEYQTFFERLRESCQEFFGSMRRQNDKGYTYRRTPAQIT